MIRSNDRRVRGAVLAALVIALAGCPDDPDKASTWTKKLSDPKDQERAESKLEGLGDPSAIPALGDLWVDKRDGRILQIIIGLAKPLTPKQAQDTFMADYEQTGRPASWDVALPYLKRALTEVSEDSQRSVDSAMKAADALGEAKLSDGLDALVEVASKPVTKKLVGVQISAIRAIGKFDGDKPKAAAALIAILGRDAPPNPRIEKEKDKQRALGEKYELYLGTTGAAINALSELRTPDDTKPLVLAMYKTPELFGQIRRALVASGPRAEADLRAILRGQNPDVETLFQDKKYDKYCGDRNEHECVPVSAKDFYPAVVIGDFYDPASVPDLLAALDRPAQPVYYLNDEPSPNTQYNAIFDAIRKIGAAEGREKLYAKWARKPGAATKKGKGGKGGKGAPAADEGGGDDLQTRILAIQAYAFVARDSSAAKELATIADSPGDNQLRQAAAEAFARLSTNPDDIKVLLRMAKTQFDASVKQKAIAAKEKPKADAADAELEKFKQAYSTANLNAAKVSHESKDQAEIKAAQAAKKQAEADLKDAKKKHRDATLPYKAADRAVSDLRSYGRLFISHIARIVVAMHCNQDLDCYAKTLTMKPDKAVEDVAPYLKGFDADKLSDWSNDDKLGLVEGEVERAMLEIGKRGQAATRLTDALLASVKSDDRLVRESILLALPKIAKVPCKSCEQQLDAAIRASAGKATMQDLNLETQMLENYFAWAGGNTPMTKQDAAQAPAEQQGSAVQQQQQQQQQQPAPQKPAAPEKKDTTPAPAHGKAAAPPPKKPAGKRRR